MVLNLKLQLLQNGVDVRNRIPYIQPGKPKQSDFIERYNGSYRRGVLNKYIFEDLDQIREQTQIWMKDYNTKRPHDALGKMALIEYAKINSLLEPSKKSKTII